MNRLNSRAKKRRFKKKKFRKKGLQFAELVMKFNMLHMLDIRHYNPTCEFLCPSDIKYRLATRDDIEMLLKILDETKLYSESDIFLLKESI